MKESQALQDPKEHMAHRVPVVPLEFLEVLDHQVLASEEPPGGLA